MVVNFWVYTKYTQKAFLRILSIRKRLSGVYLAYAEGHQAYTKYEFEELGVFCETKPPLTPLSKLLGNKIFCGMLKSI